MVVDTGFAGIAIDGDVAKELNLPAVGRTSVQGVEGNILQSSYRALLLMSVGEIDGENLAIGVPVKAVCLPKIRASYDAYGLATQDRAR